MSMATSSLSRTYELSNKNTKSPKRYFPLNCYLNPQPVWSALRLDRIRAEYRAGRVFLGLCDHFAADRRSVREIRRQEHCYVHFRHVRCADGARSGDGSVSGVGDVFHAVPGWFGVGEFFRQFGQFGISKN